MTFEKRPFWVKKRRTVPGKLDRSRLVVVNKFKKQCAFARKANAPEPDVTRIQYEMQLAELAALKAGTPRPKFPFSAHDVAAIHTQRQGEPGTWFRLHDGRVFSSTGEPESSDVAAYGDA